MKLRTTFNSTTLSVSIVDSFDSMPSHRNRRLLLSPRVTNSGLEQYKHRNQSLDLQDFSTLHSYIRVKPHTKHIEPILLKPVLSTNAKQLKKSPEHRESQSNHPYISRLSPPESYKKYMESRHWIRKKEINNKNDLYKVNLDNKDSTKLPDLPFVNKASASSDFKTSQRSLRIDLQNYMNIIQPELK